MDNKDFWSKITIDSGGKSPDFDDKETEKRDKANLNSKKELSAHQIFSAIATAAYQTSEYTNSKRHNSFDEEQEKSYWVECPMTNGLKFKFKDNKLVLILSKEIKNPLKIDNHYENSINASLDGAVKEIKKKYKEITGKSLSLTADTDVYEQIVPLSLVRQIRVYSCMYKIGGIESMREEAEKETKELFKSALEKADQMTVFKKTKKS